MKLTAQECLIFYKLHPALMWYANDRLNILADQPEDPAEFYALEAEERSPGQGCPARPARHDRTVRTGQSV